MKKVKYYYNTHTLRYEKIEKSLGKRLLNVLGFLSTALVFAFVIIVLAYTYIDSPKEKQLKREIAQMEFQYELLNERMEQMNKVLAGLSDRDDNIYRVIFEAEPIPSSIREAGTGGANNYGHLENYRSADLMSSTAQKLDKLSKKLYIQSKSYDELKDLITNKEQMLASIPAIQPVANTDLKRIASGFGYRIDPIYKTRKMHYGVDFTAPTGTEVYTTGDGVVKEVTNSRRGYGKHIVIDHGFGYETLYAHLSAIKVKRGQTVKRGELIGLVGNTGKSTAPHLHYEVFKNGKKINPINFFFNDLTPDEFERMLEMSSRHSQSFD